MPVTLRQRLDCHYCGHRSKQTPAKKAGGRFKCEHCLAVNFFDEKGEIADVPQEEAAPFQQFAQQLRGDPLGDAFSSTQDSIFCSTCLKNQHLYTYNLSQFLPDPDHPEYNRLEAELPEYKKALEQRYPQCCVRCEPKVKAQLQKATYTARSDHLRRVLDKSRQRRTASRFGWRSLLVSAAGLGHFSSLAVQILWHLYGSQVTGSSTSGHSQPQICLRHLEFNAQCLHAMEPAVGLSLVLGLMCIWWNPKWQHKLDNSEGRLTGLHQYYFVQLVLLGVRFLAWIVMFHVPMALRIMTMLHAGFAVGIVVLAGWSSYGIVKIVRNTPIDWHQDPAPLLNSRQYVPPPQPQARQPLRDSDRPFSVSSLAGPSRPTYEPWNPPPPPLDSADSMDWTPSQQSFQPQLKDLRYKSTAPTPFHGTLPALNPRGVGRNSGQGPSGREAMGIPPGFFDKPAASAFPDQARVAAREAMAQPRFFGYQEADTGLENIFDSVFSLRDPTTTQEAPVPRKVGVRGQQDIFQAANFVDSSQPAARRSPSSIFSGFLVALVLIGLALLISEGAIKPEPTDFGYYVVLGSALVPVIHILLAIFSGSTKYTGVGVVLMYAIETGVLIATAQCRTAFGTLYRDLWDKLAIAVVALLLPQEFIGLSRLPTATGPHHGFSAQQAPFKASRAAALHTAPSAARVSDNALPELARQPSYDSDQSDRSLRTTTTEADPWATPRPAQTDRYSYFETAGGRQAETANNTRYNTGTSTQRQTRQNTGSGNASRSPSMTSSSTVYGMNGLSLGGDERFAGMGRRGNKSSSKETAQPTPRRRW
jgi:hypothetical protein